MTRNPYPRYVLMMVLFVVLVMGLFGAFAIAGTATAQETPTNPLDNETNETSEDEEPETLYDQEGNLDVLEVEYDADALDAEITVRWNGRAPERVTFTQIDTDEGRAAIEQRRLPPDEEVTLGVDLVSDEHGLLYADENMENQRAMVVEFEDTEARDVTLLRGLIYGGAVFGIATVGMAWRRTKTFGEPRKEELNG